MIKAKNESYPRGTANSQQIPKSKAPTQSESMALSAAYTPFPDQRNLESCLLGGWVCFGVAKDPSPRSRVLGLKSHL